MESRRSSVLDQTLPTQHDERGYPPYRHTTETAKALLPHAHGDKAGQFPRPMPCVRSRRAQTTAASPRAFPGMEGHMTREPHIHRVPTPRDGEPIDRGVMLVLGVTFLFALVALASWLL
jgi:hypothetical protein